MAKKKLEDLSDDELMAMHDKEVGPKKLEDLSDDELMALHQEATKSDDSPLETFGKAALDDTTLGHGPQVISGLKNAWTSEKEYVAERDKQREDLENTDNPKAKTAGSLTGMAVVAVVGVVAVFVVSYR